jgi:hypothetical protein
MSLAIDVDNVTAVLIAGTWYEVADESFELDSYEYMTGELILHGGGTAGITAAGYRFKTRVGAWMYGPLTAIQSVRVSR